MKLISIKVLVNSLMCHRKLFFFSCKTPDKKKCLMKKKRFLYNLMSVFRGRFRVSRVSLDD